MKDAAYAAIHNSPEQPASSDAFAADEPFTLDAQIFFDDPESERRADIYALFCEMDKAEPEGGDAIPAHVWAAWFKRGLALGISDLYSEWLKHRQRDFASRKAAELAQPCPF